MSKLIKIKQGIGFYMPRTYNSSKDVNPNLLSRLLI